MTRTRLKACWAAIDKYGGIALGLIVVIALGVLTSIIPIKNEQSAPDQQQVTGDDDGETLPMSSGTVAGDEADLEQAAVADRPADSSQVP